MCWLLPRTFSVSCQGQSWWAEALLLCMPPTAYLPTPIMS